MKKRRFRDTPEYTAKNQDKLRQLEGVVAEAHKEATAFEDLTSEFAVAKQNTGVVNSPKVQKINVLRAAPEKYPARKRDGDGERFDDDHKPIKIVERGREKKEELDSNVEEEREKERERERERKKRERREREKKEREKKESEKEKVKEIVKEKENEKENEKQREKEWQHLRKQEQLEKEKVQKEKDQFLALEKEKNDKFAPEEEKAEVKSEAKGEETNGEETKGEEAKGEEAVNAPAPAPEPGSETNRKEGEARLT